jgi:2-amino-4-hydroxy-6-hydroxymethyldihydropteridine diphosphokinase
MSQGLFIDSDTLGKLPPLRQVVFSLGSNEGESADILQGAVNLLAETPNLVLTGVSSVYQTKPVGYLDQPDFLNIVLTGETMMAPMTLLDRAMAIEAAYGRTREIRNGPRTLDIDLIAVGDVTSDTEELQLPHPRAHERAFVLVPWLEVDPNSELPVGRVADLVARIDTAGVKRLDSIKIALP